MNFDPLDPFGTQKKMIEDAFKHAGKLSEKYMEPVYLVFLGESFFVEREKPLVGSCTRYYTVNDGLIYCTEVNLGNGTESESLLEDQVLIEESKFKTMKKEEEHGEYRYSYLVKESGDKSYYSFDGGKHWSGSRKDAWNEASIRKNRMISIPEKGVWPETSQEAISYIESVSKLTEEEGFKEVEISDLSRIGKLGSGFGYHGHILRDPEVYPDPMHKKSIVAIDKAFVAAANKLKLPMWKIGGYSDSKKARKDMDDLSGLILDPKKTGEDFYLKEPEDVFQISYDFFLKKMDMFFDQMSSGSEEKLKNYWQSALEN